MLVAGRLIIGRLVSPRCWISLRDSELTSWGGRRRDRSWGDQRDQGGWSTIGARASGTVGFVQLPLRRTSRRLTLKARILDPMVEITIKRREGGFTFLVNGRDDVVVHPDGEVTTFASEEAARETAERVVQALLRAGEVRSVAARPPGDDELP
jgi:hypothetical protein